MIKTTALISTVIFLTWMIIATTTAEDVIGRPMTISYIVKDICRTLTGTTDTRTIKDIREGKQYKEGVCRCF